MLQGGALRATSDTTAACCHDDCHAVPHWMLGTPATNTKSNDRPLGGVGGVAVG